MLQCDNCEKPISDEGFIFVNVVSPRRRDNYLVCSPDCLIDATANIFALMKRLKQNHEADQSEMGEDT